MPDNTKSAQPIDQYVGRRIRSRRMQIGMSQEKLGEALGITFQQVQKYEKGTNRVGASRLHAIGKVLGVDPSYFFEGTMDSTGVPRPEMEFLESAEGTRLFKALHRIEEPIMRRVAIAAAVAAVEAVANTQGTNGTPHDGRSRRKNSDGTSAVPG